MEATVQGGGERGSRTSQHGVAWVAVRDHARTVGAAVFSTWASGVNLVAGDRAIHADQQKVGSGFFGVLGVQPMFGREFSPDEDRRGGPAAVLLSHEFWRGTMGGDPSAVGRSITLRGVVASIGAGLGCILGAAVLQGLTGLAENALDLWQPIAMDARAVLAAVAVALVATIIFGLIPALHSTRMAQALTSAGTRTVAGAASHLSRRAAVVVLVALGVMLLVGAGLLARTFSHLRGLEPGFDGRGVFAASVSLQDARYQSAEDVRRLTDGALERLRDSAGVESAAASLGLPYERLLNLAFRHVDGREA